MRMFNHCNLFAAAARTRFVSYISGATTVHLVNTIKGPLPVCTTSLSLFIWLVSEYIYFLIAGNPYCTGPVLCPLEQTSTWPLLAQFSNATTIGAKRLVSSSGPAHPWGEVKQLFWAVDRCRWPRYGRDQWSQGPPCHPCHFRWSATLQLWWSAKWHTSRSGMAERTAYVAIGLSQYFGNVSLFHPN